MTPLKLGSFGLEVKTWQEFLKKSGYNIPIIDGAFGPVTDSQTKAFQKANGLTVDGVVGPKTFKFADKSDPTIDLTKKWPKQNYDSMVEFYGPVGENQTSIDVPYPLIIAWEPSQVIKKITCNEKVAHSLYKILEDTLKSYGQKDISKLKLDLFGGCLNVRKMRGGSAWSIHSWGAALDLDPDNNQLKWGKDKAAFAKKEYEPFWKIVEGEGWVSLGRSRNYDWMHFQAALL